MQDNGKQLELVGLRIMLLDSYLIINITIIFYLITTWVTIVGRGIVSIMRLCFAFLFK